MFPIKTSQIPEIFCRDCNDRDKRLIVQKHKPEPIRPFYTPVHLTSKNFGMVDKYYIETLQDHAVGIDLQKEMVMNGSVKKTFSLNTGHCPHLSDPDALVKIFYEISLY